ncbi:MAG: beta-galactosidase [Planctomycetota bacterium]
MLERWTFRILASTLAAALTAQAADVRVGKHRELLVDGEPFFPLFVWLQPPQLFEFHKGLGMNTMMGEGAKAEVSTKEFLDACKAHGLWGIVHARERNLGVKDHPALLCWMFGDEPDLPAKLGYQRPVKTPRGDEGSVNVWWEGEDAAEKSFKISSWMNLEHRYLSGGRWLPAEAKPITKDKPLVARYKVEVPETATYRLWVREFTKRWASPTWWRFDDGEWHHTSRDLRGIELQKVHRVLSVGWCDYGTVKLTQGEHTFTIKADEVRTAGRPPRTGDNAMVAFDAFLLTTSDEKPLSPPRPPRPRTLPSEIREQYEAWKKLQPDRPIYLNLTASFLPRYKRYDDSIYDAYCRATDIIGYDHYPIYGWGKPDRVPEIAAATAKLRGHAPDDVPVWAILETTDGGQWTSDDMRAPHPHEIRAEVWMAIVNGAKAIGYFPHVWKPRYTWCRIPKANQAELRRLNAQITRLAPVLLSPRPERQAACEAKVDVMTREHNGRRYVFAVSLARKPQSAVLRLPGLKAGTRVEVVDEGRELRAEAGRFRDEFGELAVHIYRISKQ